MYVFSETGGYERKFAHIRHHRLGRRHGAATAPMHVCLDEGVLQPPLACYSPAAGSATAPLASYSRYKNGHLLHFLANMTPVCMQGHPSVMAKIERATLL